MAIRNTATISKYQADFLKSLANKSLNLFDNGHANDPLFAQFHTLLMSVANSVEVRNFSSVIGNKVYEASCDAELFTALRDKATKHSIPTITPPKVYEESVILPFLGMLKSEDDRDINKQSTNHLQGLIDQLSSRQRELNIESKNATESMEKRAQSYLSRLEMEHNRTLSSVKNNFNVLSSEAEQKLRTLSSDTQIQLQELANTQRNELSELTAKHIDEAINEKRQVVFEQLERRSNILLSKVTEEVDGLSAKVAGEVNEFFRLNEALRKTLKYISSDALADASIAQAAIEKESADKLRIYGVSWLLLSIFLFLTTFDYQALVDKAGVPQYTLILLRSFFLIVGSAPAFYLLRESARHRTDERRYRQKGIQLATIDGYLAEFEETDRNSVKKELTKHYFHGGDHFVDASSVDSIQATYDKILDRVLGSGQAKKEQ